MNEEIKSRWIAKLESGDYDQTTGHLNVGSGYCCLGVLCEIAVEDGIVIKQATDDDTPALYTAKIDTSDYNEDIVPIAVMKWAGLPSTNPDIDDEELDVNNNLAELNDNGMTFSEIANLIRKNL